VTPFFDIVADEIATARLVDICDADLANTDECDCGCAIGRGTLCPDCRTSAAAHLYLDFCPACGDVCMLDLVHRVCPACRETGEITPAMARAALGVAA
jgi:hypothetical protein